MTKDFVIDRYDDGDLVNGTGDLEGATFHVYSYESAGTVKDALLARSNSRGQATGKSEDEVNLSDYPELEGKYQAFYTSEYDAAPDYPAYKKYIISKAEGLTVYEFYAEIPMDKVTPENEALIRAIAASVEF